MARSPSVASTSSPHVSRINSVKYEVDPDNMPVAWANLVSVTVDIGPLQHTQPRSVTLLVPAGWAGHATLQACTWENPVQLARVHVPNTDHAEPGLADRLLLAHARDRLIAVVQATLASTGDRLALMKQLHSELLAMADQTTDATTREAILGLSSDAYDASEHRGQLGHAVASAAAAQRWGEHFLRSELRAHVLHVCLNFKDAGLQPYAAPLFSAMQAHAEELFCTLPAPVPTCGSDSSATTAPANIQGYGIILLCV